MSEPASSAWTVEGSEGLPIHGDTHTPNGPPRAHILIVHGWTGCKDRNIVPALTRALADQYVIHRCTLSHAGIEQDRDRITKTDEFERDSLEFCVSDIGRVIDHASLPEQAPFILIGHSRAGATVVRCAAQAHDRGWSRVPDAIVCVAPTKTYTRFTPEMKDQLDAQGYVERPCARAEGGVVRMGPSWYEHHLSGPDRDLLAEDASCVRCPALIVHGEADDAVPSEQGASVCDALKAGACPEAQLVTIPGADHNFNAGGFGFDRENIKTPESEACADAIRRFIDRL